MWFGTSQTGEEGNWLDQAFYLSSIVGCWWILVSRKIKWKKLVSDNFSVALVFGYFLLAVLWALDPTGSFKRLFKEFGTVLAILVLFTEAKPLEAIRGVYLRCAYILIPLSVLFIRYIPELGRFYSKGGQPQYTGVTMQKNSLGEMVLVSILVLVWEYLANSHVKGFLKRVPWYHVLLFVMGIWLINISQSQTAFLCLVIGGALMLKGKLLTSPSFNKALLIFFLFLPIFILLMQQSDSFLEPLVGALGRDMTFTGRTEIWKQVLASDKINPILGTGYYDFWGSEGGAVVRSSIEGSSVHSAHNGYLDIYIDGGLVGISLLVGMLYVRGRRLTRNLTHNLFQQVRFALLIVAIFYNLSESTFWRLQPMGYVAFLVLIDPPERRTRGSRIQMPRMASRVPATAVGRAVRSF